MPNFTFKKIKHEGRYASFERDQTTIKFQKKECGYMTEDRLGVEWVIRFAIKKEKTKEDPAPFRWIRLKARFNTEKEVREWLKNVKDKIFERYDLYFFEDN